MAEVDEQGAVWEPSTQREHAVKGTWRRVNEIACSTEDRTEIRALIAEAGIEPGMHVGSDPDSFTPLMVGEWVLGQWADMIDADSPFLNSGRNISLHQYQRLTGEPDPPWTVGEPTMHAAEVEAIVDYIGGSGLCAMTNTPDRCGASSSNERGNDRDRDLRHLANNLANLMPRSHPKWWRRVTRRADWRRYIIGGSPRAS